MSNVLFLHSNSTAWYGSKNRPSPEGLKHIRDIGFPAIRYSIDASQIITAPYTYDWTTRLDLDMQLYESLGFQVLVNPQWAPPHMSEGKPTYMDLVRGCAVFDETKTSGWRYGWACGYTEDGIYHVATHDPIPDSCGRAKDDPRHGPGATMNHHPYRPEKPWCVHPNIPHLDPDQEHHFAAALADRYGKVTTAGNPLVMGWARGNEYDGMWYWPPMSEGPWEVQYDRAAVEQWGPFLRGVKSVLPDAVVIGSDAASPGGLNFSIEAMARIGLRWDRIAGHMYPTGVPFPEGTINEITRDGGWLAVMRKHNYTSIMDLEITDASGDGSMPSNGKIVDGMREIIARFPEIDAHSHHDEGVWFEGGRAAWNAGQFVPNQLYRDMKALIAETTGSVVQPPPSPPRVLTERAYRIVDMKRYVLRDRVCISPTYLFVAIRQPAIDTVRGRDLNTEWTCRGAEYLIVPIPNDALTQGDQYFELRLPYSGEAWFGPVRWSELPEARQAEFGFADDSGVRRRTVRS